MFGIVCTDMRGKTHEVSTDDMKLYTSAHGICRTADGILLVQDKLSEKWIIPGGVIDKTEKEIDGMRRGILAGTGIMIGSDVKLVTILEEDFFDIYLNEGAHITREFYLVNTIEGGTLMQHGNGVYSSAATYVADIVWTQFSDKEMDKRYKEVLELAQKNFPLK